MKSERIEVAAGEKAMIALKSAANTPFRWEMTGGIEGLDTEMDIVPLRPSGQNPQLKSMFNIAARKPGTYKVDFALTAPFISAPISRKSYEITFN